MAQEERLAENLLIVKQKAGSAKIVAVTKYVSTDIMQDLYELGVKRMGENRSQALLAKQKALVDIADDIEWHFIGNLQTRQVKDIINHIDYLHSLDRLKLAQQIQSRALETVKCFVQVNISGEDTKSGWSLDELDQAIEDLATFDKIQVVGLMTMAPYDASESELRDIFSQLRSAQERIASLGYSHAPCQELSMGMSQDYPIAVQEGATYIRVGSALYEGLEED